MILIGLKCYWKFSNMAISSKKKFCFEIVTRAISSQLYFWPREKRNDFAKICSFEISEPVDRIDAGDQEGSVNQSDASKVATPQSVVWPVSWVRRKINAIFKFKIILVAREERNGLACNKCKQKTNHRLGDKLYRPSVSSLYIQVRHTGIQYTDTGTDSWLDNNLDGTRFMFNSQSK